MTARDEARGTAVGWVASGAAVLAAHGAILWALIGEPATTAEATDSGALVIELAPIAVARPDLPAEIAPGPDQVQAAAAPEAPRVEEQKPEPDPEREPPVAPPMAEPPQKLAPVEGPDPLRLEQEQRPEQTAAPSPPPNVAVPVTTASQAVSEQVAVAAAAPVRGLPRAEPSLAVPRWTTRLLERLERAKRYPVAAQRRREEGTATIAFSIDRQGNLISARIQHSSGSPALDEEALDMMRRAAPLPPPPADLTGDPVALSVPVRFRLR